MPQTPLKIREYRSTDFNAWLDLTAISSIELDEEFLIWNKRPQLPANSISYLLLNDDATLKASVDISSLPNKEYCVQHWAVRKKYLLNEFPQFLNQINHLKKISFHIWLASSEAKSCYLSLPNVKQIDSRVSFFLEGNIISNEQLNFGFCDHIFGTSSVESFAEIEKNLPVVKKNFLSPKFQSCLEFSWN